MIKKLLLSLSRSFFSCIRNIDCILWQINITAICGKYLRLTRGHTPDSVPFRRFPSFSLWWAPAHLHRRKAKITRKLPADRCFAVLTELKCGHVRRSPQRILVYSQGLQRNMGAFEPAKTVCPLVNRRYQYNKTRYNMLIPVEVVSCTLEFGICERTGI